MVAELTDSHRDGEPKECLIGSPRYRGTAVFAVACPFCGTRNVWDMKERFRNCVERKYSAARFRGVRCGSEFANPLLETGSLHGERDPAKRLTSM